MDFKKSNILSILSIVLSSVLFFISSVSYIFRQRTLKRKEHELNIQLEKKTLAVQQEINKLEK
jgi:hypothetical protein